MHYPNKTVYEGQWNYGEYQGQGTFSWSDGSSYSGQYEKGKKQGYGKFTYASKKYYEGGWVNGKQEGEGAVYNAQGIQVQKGAWKEGVFQPEKPVDKPAEQ